MQFKSTFAFIVLSATSVLGQACTPQQLKGTFGSFSLPGGGGVYQAGTNQVVSFNYPAGAPISSITSIAIVGGGQTYLPATVGALPTFNIGTTSGGGVNVQLPLSLPAGSFVFRVTLSTTTGTCTINSAPFTGLAAPPTNQCTLGTSRCVTTSTFQTCITSPSGNVYGAATNCGAGLSCTQAGNNAICTAGTPSFCTEFGRYTCSGDSYRICTYNANAVLQLSNPISCGAGNTCQTSGNSIVCVTKNTPPANECTLGQRQCITPTSFRQCIVGPLGNSIFGAAENCAGGQTCNNGICAVSTPTACTLGYQRCASSTTFQVCTQIVGGTQFGVVQSCATGTRCNPYLSNYIQCV